MTVLHKHHIIPRHVGGTDDDSNIILLTIEEHAAEHKRLYDLYGRWQDYCAWVSLSGQIPKAEINRLRSINRDTSYMQKPEYKEKHKLGMKNSPNVKATKGSFKEGHKRPQESIEKQRATITGKKRGPYKKEHVDILEFRGKRYPSISAARQDTGASFYTVKRHSQSLVPASEHQP